MNIAVSGTKRTSRRTSTRRARLTGVLKSRMSLMLAILFLWSTAACNSRYEYKTIKFTESDDKYMAEFQQTGVTNDFVGSYFQRQQEAAALASNGWTFVENRVKKGSATLIFRREK
jgi:hypothetical protein